MGRLAAQAFTLDALRDAWREVLDNDLEDGALSRGVARFNDDAEERLTRLSTDLAWGAYLPADLTEAEIPAEGRAPRVLHIPSVPDRVVARAILDVITPTVDPVLGPAAYAYRPGLGVVDATQELARLRDEPLPWVVRTDIDDCFPTIPVPLARRRLAALTDDDDLQRVVDLLLARPARSRRRGRRTMRGLPQGCPLSPVLANLVLMDVDMALLQRGFPVIRYGDDMAIATRTRGEAMEALRCAAEAVERLGMKLGEDDTFIMSFEDGFTFLGEDFGPRYPPVLSEARIETPERKVLYLGTQGGRVRIGDGRLIVESGDDTELLDVASSKVGRIVTFGAVGVSAGVRSWAMSTGVDVVFASRRGTYLGSLVGAADTARTDRVRAQLAVADSEHRLPLCRALVAAKITKQAVVLQRFARPEHADEAGEAVSQLKQFLRMLDAAMSVSEIMGLEGAAAAAYFPVFGSLFPEGLRFDHRSRQPPLDLTNSALSFLYTVLLGECVTALYASGLDPAFGVLHSDADRRPSLALDLLEELRPLIVDQIVLSAARRRELRPEHARTEDGRAGVYLTRAGREGLLDAYERRMLTRTSGAIPGFSGTMRRHVYRQAQRLSTAIMNPEAGWTGMSWR